MDNKNIPYAVQMAAALLAKKDEAAFNVVKEALSDIIVEALDLTAKYDYVDLPFVIASMKIVADALESTLDEQGKILTKNIINKTSSIVINATDMMRQAMEEKEDDEEKAD